MPPNSAEMHTPIWAQGHEDGTKARATCCCHRNERERVPAVEPHGACTPYNNGLFAAGNEGDVKKRAISKQTHRLREQTCGCQGGGGVGEGRSGIWG